MDLIGLGLSTIESSFLAATLMNIGVCYHQITQLMRVELYMSLRSDLFAHCLLRSMLFAVVFFNPAMQFTVSLLYRSTDQPARRESCRHIGYQIFKLLS